MYKTLLTLLLLTVSGFSVAATLNVGDNVNVLAARNAKFKPLDKSVTLGSGEQAIIVRFDAPTDPGSANESQGRVTSDAWLLTFTPPASGELTLSTQTPRTENDTRKVAKNPHFLLSSSTGSVIAMSSKPVAVSQESLMTDYSEYLPPSTLTSSGMTDPNAATQNAQPGSLPQTQSEFLKLSATQRKAFLRWALEL
ncbi:DUF2057 family protein [Rahnella woolbedingensis]|uniref:DUF2057 domain-containing protein n=1 Tax=Rahnella woolbedingensis TaxID=1510574 RepID=A0A419N2V3_9GAMM|nr:DUF2057 family protein [Rahnella woolbedingensis]RJT35123.1 DUF2057 domain-containing protein [Rahnella woolbedingensis]